MVLKSLNCDSLNELAATQTDINNSAFMHVVSPVLIEKLYRHQGMGQSCKVPIDQV